MVNWPRHGSLILLSHAFFCVALAACDVQKRRLLWADEPQNDGSVSVLLDAAGPTFVPTSIVLTERLNSSLHGGMGETDAHADTCPGDQVLVGARGSLFPEAFGEGTRPLVGSIAAICAEVSLPDDASSNISTGPTATLQERGTVREMTWTQLCPSGQIVVGIGGRSGEALDQIQILCAEWRPSPGEGRLVRATDTALGLPLEGGTGGMAFQEWCPEGQLAAGLLIKAGFVVDALGISCATAQLAH